MIRRWTQILLNSPVSTVEIRKEKYPLELVLIPIAMKSCWTTAAMNALMIMIMMNRPRVVAMPLLRGQARMAQELG